MGGSRDELRYTAPLPGRVGRGRHVVLQAVARAGAGQDRDGAGARPRDPRPRRARLPSFAEAERSVLADDVKALKISYYGRDKGATFDTAPTWRAVWDDSQQLPLLIQVDVTPRVGAPWPPIVVAPRAAPEAGCRAWDTIRVICVGA